MRKRQRVFIEEYLRCWNATEAAKRAGYSEKAARQMGSENLSKPYIASEIKRRLEERAMTADEALDLLAFRARNIAADYIDDKGEVDLKKIINDGNQRLIKGIKRDRRGRKIVEFLDPDTSLDRIGRHLKLFGDKTEVDVTVRVEGLDQVLDNIYGSPDDQG